MLVKTDRSIETLLDTVPVDVLLLAAIKKMVAVEARKIVKGLQPTNLPSFPEADKMIGKEEAAKFLGYSVSWLNKALITRPDLLHNRSGGRVLFPLGSLAEWRDKFTINKSSQRKY